MLAYIIRRILASIPVMVVVALFVFLLLRLTPGDPAAIIAGDMATPAQLEQIRQNLGLNEPLVTQFVTWSGQLLSGDFGRSLISKTPVLTLIHQRLEPTLSLAIVTMIITLLLSIPMGVVAAWRHATLTDSAIMAISVLGFSIPVFVTGYILIQIFAIDLRVFPIQGFRSISDGFWPFFERIVLPALTLATIYIALIARMTRAAMLDVLDEDYVRTARAKGAGEARLMFHHIMRNALLPVITLLGLQFSTLLGGSVVVESVFSLPGLGSLAYQSVVQRDLNTLMGIIFMSSVVVVAVNFLTDLLYARLDSRIELA